MMNSYEVVIISIYGELMKEASKSLDFTMVGRTPIYNLCFIILIFTQNSYDISSISFYHDV